MTGIMDTYVLREAPSKETVTGVFIIKNDRGLHTRPSTEVVKCANQFKADIQLKYEDMTVSARSILGILMLAAERGAEIEVIAEGVDAEEAVQAFIQLADVCFYMKY